MNLTKEFSLRAINGMNSISGGQGFLRCNCAGACNKTALVEKLELLTIPSAIKTQTIQSAPKK